MKATHKAITLLRSQTSRCVWHSSITCLAQNIEFSIIDASSFSAITAHIPIL